MARKPFAKPTAIMLAESQVTHVHNVFGAHALKAGSSYLTAYKSSSGVFCINNERMSALTIACCCSCVFI